MKKAFKTNRNTVIQLMINLLIGLWALLICSSPQDQSVACGFLSMAQLLINIWFMRRSRIPWFSFSMLFCLATYIFHLSNVFLLAIGQGKYCVYDILNSSINIRDYNFSSVLAIFCSGLTVTGILYAYGSFHADLSLNRYRSSKVSDNVSRRKILALGLILLAISAIPSLYLQFLRVNVVLTGGLYSNTRSVDRQLGIFYYLTRFMPFALIMIMIGMKHKKRTSLIIYVVSCAYEAFCMISGNRALQLIAIATYSFVYFNIVRKKKIRFRILVLFAILGYFAAAAVNMIMEIRDFGILSYDLSSVFLNILKDNPLFAVIGEFGNTQLSVSLAISNYPEHVGFKFGTSYLFGLSAAIPNIGSIIDWMQTKAVYLYDFVLGAHYSLGGSYIAELYANFGWFGILFAPLVGFWIGKTCSSIFKSIEKENWCRLVSLLVLFYFNLFWVRNFFYGFVFTYVWTSLYIKFFGAALNGSLKRR